MFRKMRSFVKNLLIAAGTGGMSMMYAISAYANDGPFEIPQVDSGAVSGQFTDPTLVMMPVLMAYMGVIAVIALAVILFQCVARMFLFRKAGIAGWKAWIPVYSDYTLFKLTTGCGWLFFVWILACFIPFAGAFAAILGRVFLAVAVMYAYGESWIIGVLYFFASPVAELIIGLNRSTYVGSGPIREKFHF